MFEIICRIYYDKNIMFFYSSEKKRDILLESSSAQTYNKKRISKTQNITELPLKQSNPRFVAFQFQIFYS